MKDHEEYAGYLFAYFKGEGYADGEQVYFALSKGNDPLRYMELNGGRPVLTSELGERGVRDPFIIRSPHGDQFYLIATDLKIHENGGWERSVTAGSRSIMIWSSADLVHWSDQSMVEVAPSEAGCAWAPEAFYDEASGDYYVYWASMLNKPGTSSGEDRYHRMLCSKTKDFITFSEPFIYMDYGYSVIDMTMIEHQGKIYRLTKGRHVIQETGHSIDDPNFTLINENVEQAFMERGEGPIIFKSNLEDKWYSFIDEYGIRGYIPLETTDLASGVWTESENYDLPDKPRHGSIIPVTRSEYERLLRQYGGKTDEESKSGI